MGLLGNGNEGPPFYGRGMVAAEMRSEPPPHLTLPGFSQEASSTSSHQPPFPEEETEAQGRYTGGSNDSANS